MKRLIPLLKVLGTQFNSEHTETVLQVKRAPFEGDLRKMVRCTEQAIRVTTRIETWECLWWSGHEETSWVNYHVVHFLHSGHKLAFAQKKENTTVVDYLTLSKLYAESVKAVFTKRK